MRQFIEFAEYIFREITYTSEEITPEFLDWKPHEESNSIRWILTHQTRIASILLPQVITGTNNPSGWDDDYQEQHHSLDELRNDLKEAKQKTLSLLNGLDEDAMNKEIMIWGSKHPRKEAIYALLGELLHHNGQITMIKGIKRRISKKKTR